MIEGGRLAATEYLEEGKVAEAFQVALEVAF
jgi:flavin-binding protein dodecin